MIPDLPADIDQIKGFLAQDEAQALYQQALEASVLGPVLEIGSYCGKSTIYLGLACRIAAELGAKIVKTYYSPEDFDKVTNGCPVPVVIAGGPKCETELEVFEFVYDGIQKGAIGVNLGRNVWQSPYPLAMMRGLNGVIHDNLTPSEASDLYQTIKEEQV